MKNRFLILAVAMLSVSTVMSQEYASSGKPDEWWSTIDFEEGLEEIRFPVPFDGYKGTLVFPESTKSVVWTDCIMFDKPTKNPPPPPEGYEVGIQFFDDKYEFIPNYYWAGHKPELLRIVCKAEKPPHFSYDRKLDFMQTGTDPRGWNWEEFVLYVPLESVLEYRNAYSPGAENKDQIYTRFKKVRPIQEYYASIGMIEENADVPAEYYTLEGVKLPGYPQQNGIYVERRGGESKKIMITNL